MTNLIEVAKRRLVLGDGAMGTQLQQAGLEPGGCGDLWNLEHPDRVLEIQRRYVEAGSELLITSTFGSNRYVLARYDAEDRVHEVNLAGAAVARKANGNAGWVLGDIGPFGGFLEPLGDHSEAEVLEAFGEQARALMMGGVDGIIIETMTALDELQVAIRAAREAGAPIVVASLSFDATKVGLRTMMGATPEDAARAALAAGADVLGANCGTGLTMEDFAEIVRRYRSVDAEALVMVQGNAGQPELVGTDIVYGVDAERMAASLEPVLAAGVNILGGCCGTTPEHIRAFAHMTSAAGRVS